MRTDGIPDFSGSFTTPEILQKCLNDIRKAHELTLKGPNTKIKIKPQNLLKK